MFYLHARDIWKTTVEYTNTKITCSLESGLWFQPQEVLLLKFEIGYSDYIIQNVFDMKNLQDNLYVMFTCDSNSLTPWSIRH